MRNVMLFIAMSLDGYIAAPDGGVGWLAGQGEEEPFDAYGAFIREVDTVLMGWNTYHQIAAELSPEVWPYAGLTSYVLTHRAQRSTGEIRFTAEDPCALVRRLRQQEGKSIWVCGGAQLAGQLMAEDLIDTYYISVIPTLLGDGIRLFGKLDGERKLRLVETRSYDGIVDLVYVKR